jgi:3-dehydroquinate synthase
MNTRLLLDQKLSNLSKFLKKEKHVVIITDKTVKKLYGRQLPKTDTIVIGEGEKIKDLSTVYQICRVLLELGAGRESLIVGIGGGIVCDISGLVASTFMRGLRFGFVPTTLLAQVDASLGGKNGVNVDHYKNMFGVIRQPEFVYYDFNVLKTLPEKEMKCGFAEVLKHTIISGWEMNRASIKNIVQDSIRTKLGIVGKDVNDYDERRVLNLGHTMGHAIEAVSKGKVSHGEAVAIGICFSARFSYSLGLLSQKDLDKIINMVASFGLPMELPKGIKKASIIDAMTKDKKKGQNDIDIVLIKGIGKVFLKKMGIKKIGGAVHALC